MNFVISLNYTFAGDKPFQMLVMDKNLEEHVKSNLRGSMGTEKINVEKSNKYSEPGNFSRILHRNEKSDKCNHCDYTSSNANILKTHLKTHSGEKANKCNQCNYASSQAGNMKTHLTTQCGEKSN